MPHPALTFRAARCLRLPYRSTALGLVWLALAMTLASCASGPPLARPWSFSAPQGVAPVVDTWFQSGQAPDLGTPGTQEERFFQGEVLFWQGDAEAAFEQYRAVLEADPSHPLARLASVRLVEMQHQVVDFHARLAPALAPIGYASIHPLTRQNLAILAHGVALQRWLLSESEAPFAADDTGYPALWRATPVLSHWRLTDLDTPFAPESQPSLQAHYRSPAAASDTPSNNKPTRTLHTTSRALSPRFTQAGVYYLETFVTVAPTPGRSPGAARDFWLHGNFVGAARVWIDGTEVMRREEHTYDSSQRLTHIRLTPGTYRLLVKLAFQPGYRDWFELAWTAHDAGPLKPQGLAFSPTRPAKISPGQIDVVMASQPPSALDPILASGATDTMTRYLKALAALEGRDAKHFEEAWEALVAAHPRFAPAQVLKATQVATLWEIPGELRDTTALSHLRRAQQLAPDNPAMILRLAEGLRGRGNEREMQLLLQRARDQAVDTARSPRQLRNAAALVAWASYLQQRNWNENAENAWRELLALAPGHCTAAGRLQGLLHARSHFAPPEQITPAWKQCPELYRQHNQQRPDRHKERLEWARRQALRYPWRPDAQLAWVQALTGVDRPGEAREQLEKALERLFDAEALIVQKASFALEDEGPQAAARVLREAMAAHGHRGWLLWRLATLEDRIPLQDLVTDGLARAMTEVEATRSKGPDGVPPADQRLGDEAYYVVDFAARQQLPDGAALSLTHTVVRVMTKSAIDRFGETQVPEQARLLIARTIKQDGSTRAPEEVAGKQTLSMPGLAEGDFVELAWLEFLPAPSVSAHLEGTRFYFRMPDISTLHSEFVYLGPKVDLISRNGAPQGEPVTHEGLQGLRYLARDQPRPREEPAPVASGEFLPWVQHYQVGWNMDALDAERRYASEMLRDSLKRSRQLDEQIAQWTRALPKARGEALKQLFYTVTAWMPEARPNALGVDATHALLTRRGSPLLLLKAACDAAELDAEIFVARTYFEEPEALPVGEFARYSRALLRARNPENGQFLWLDPSGPDAMFGALDPDLAGQPAICLSCQDFVRDTLPAQIERPSVRDIAITGELDRHGTLRAQATLSYHGARAAAVRSALRARPDETARDQYFQAILADLMPGSSLSEARIIGQDNFDEPVALQLAFERPQYATPMADGALRLQTALFREPLASQYAQLAQRSLPLAVAFSRNHRASLRMKLPAGRTVEIQSRQGSWNLASDFGRYERRVQLESQELQVDSHLELPLQRVTPEHYASFRDWAIATEQSSVVLMEWTPAAQP